MEAVRQSLSSGDFVNAEARESAEMEETLDDVA
jgi:hypothetical protein